MYPLWSIAGVVPKYSKLKLGLSKSVKLKTNPNCVVILTDSHSISEGARERLLEKARQY